MLALLSDTTKVQYTHNVAGTPSIHMIHTARAGFKSDAVRAGSVVMVGCVCDGRPGLDQLASTCCSGGPAMRDNKQRMTDTGWSSRGER